MTTPRMQALMAEYGLEIDDVRWFLSVRLTDELMSYQTRQWELIQEIWSGRLADRLYNLEERWMEENERLLAEGLSEEGKLRELFAECRAARRRRRLRRGDGGGPFLA